MITKLFRVLNNVETRRQSLIKTIKEKGLQIDDSAGFETINAKVDSLTPIVPDTSYDNFYYDDPEDDPVVWKVPREWPDIETIVKSKRSYFRTVDDVEYELYPYEIILYSTDLPTINFRLASWANYAIAQPANTLTVGTIYSTTRINYGCYLSLETNDGTFIDFAPSTSEQIIEHTFDNSKDIIGEDGKHYKYVILYQSIRKLSITTKVDNTTRNNALFFQHPRHSEEITSYAMVVCPIFVPRQYAGYSSNSSSSTKNTSNIQYAKYITNGFYYVREAKDETYDYNMLFYEASPITGGRYLANYKRIEVQLRIDNMTRWEGYIIGYEASELNTLITNIKKHPITTSIAIHNLVYLNCRIPVPGMFNYQNRVVRCIKYIRGYDIALMDEYYVNNYSAALYKLIYGPFPYLEDFFPLIHNLEGTLPTIGSSSLLRFGLKPHMNLFVNKAIPQAGCFEHSGRCNIVDLPTYTGTDFNIVRGLTCNKVILSGMTEIKTSVALGNTGSTTFNYGLPDIGEIDMSNVLTITATGVLISASYFNCNNTHTINASSLKTLQNADAFTCFEKLRTLILPQDFKYKLNLSTNYELSIDTVKDLFVKAATLAEGETYTLTLSGILKEVCEQLPEYQEILNKGWTVTFTNKSY